MADYTYDPGLVVDDATGQAVPNATGELRATISGSPVAVYDMLGNPLAGLTTNPKGIVNRFRADISVGYIYFGSVPQRVASDQQQEALAAAEAAQTAAQAAQTQATTAAGQAATSATAASAAQASAAAAAAAAAAITVPTTAAAVGARAADEGYWNGSTWSARAPGSGKTTWYSDGTKLSGPGAPTSVDDPAAPAPPAALDGDDWYVSG